MCLHVNLIRTGCLHVLISKRRQYTRTHTTHCTHTHAHIKIGTVTVQLIAAIVSSPALSPAPSSCFACLLVSFVFACLWFFCYFSYFLPQWPSFCASKALCVCLVGGGRCLICCNLRKVLVEIHLICCHFSKLSSDTLSMQFLVVPHTLSLSVGIFPYFAYFCHDMLRDVNLLQTSRQKIQNFTKS